MVSLWASILGAQHCPASRLGEVCGGIVYSMQHASSPWRSLCRSCVAHSRRYHVSRGYHRVDALPRLSIGDLSLEWLLDAPLVSGKPEGFLRASRWQAFEA